MSVGMANPLFCGLCRDCAQRIPHAPSAYPDKTPTGDAAEPLIFKALSGLSGLSEKPTPTFVGIVGVLFRDPDNPIDPDSILSKVEGERR